MATTDFDEWLAHSEPANDDEAMHLYHAMRDKSSHGVYEVQPKDGRLLIRKNDDWLLLASEIAIEAFGKRVDGYCPDPEMGWHGWEMYVRAMNKDR